MFGITKTYTLCVSFHIKKPSLHTIDTLITAIKSVPVFDYISVEMQCTESKGWTTLRRSSVDFTTKEGALEALQTYADQAKKGELQ